MNRLHVILLLCVSAALLPAAAGCSSATHTVDDEFVLEGPGRSAHEREANLAALEELRQRALDAPAPPPPADAGLEVVVLGPERPSALTEDGALKRSAVDEFLALGPHAVLGAVELVPARGPSGSVQGFRVQNLLAGSEFMVDGGLRQGDVIAKVNGRSIILPDAFMEVWESLATADVLSVELLRDGDPATLEWPIRDGI